MEGILNSDNLTSDVFTEPVRPFGLGRITNYNLNNRTDCPSDALPSLPAYFSAINSWGVALFGVGGLFVILTLASFIDTLIYIMANSPPRVKTHSAFVLAVYPIVSAACFCSTVVPRSQLLSEAVTQFMFMAGMYQLFCLLVAYCGGEAELIRRVKPHSLNTRVGPCCCWPCCCCLPIMAVDKFNVRFLRLLVLQLPLVQSCVYMVLLVMWAERESLYQVNYMYVQPVIIVSILVGIWGMSMTMRLLGDVLRQHSVPGKFIVLQAVLLCAKMQGLLARGLVWLDLLPCRPPLSPLLTANLIHNSLMLAEMLILSLLARKLYKRSLPEFAETNNNIQQVYARSSYITTIGAIMTTVPALQTSDIQQEKTQANGFITRF